MNVKIEELEKNKVKLEVTVPAEKFSEGLDKAFSKNRIHFKIPGFRNGKAPRNIVERHYGEEILFEDAFNFVLSEMYENLLKENNLNPASEPDIDVVQIGKDKDLIFTAIIETIPDINLSDYKNISIEKVEYTVSDEDVQKELKTMQDKNARLISVEDKAVENGNITVIDFEGFVDSVAFDGGKAENYELTIGGGQFIPGFEEQIIGMNIGDEKEINVNFPDEYFSEDLKGKQATFKIKLHSIKEKQLPELNDEFAKDYSEFDSLEELKADIKTKLEKFNVKKAEQDQENKIIDALIEKIEIDVPQSMVKNKIEEMTKDFEEKIKYQGMNINTYMELTGSTMEDLKNQFAIEATKEIKLKLILNAITKQENLEVTEAEIETKLEEFAKYYGKNIEELRKNENVINYIKEKNGIEKALKFLSETLIK